MIFDFARRRGGAEDSHLAEGHSSLFDVSFDAWPELKGGCAALNVISAPPRLRAKQKSRRLSKMARP